jgi:hypothetical protein
LDLRIPDQFNKKNQTNKKIIKRTIEGDEERRKEGMHGSRRN